MVPTPAAAGTTSLPHFPFLFVQLRYGVLTGTRGVTVGTNAITEEQAVSAIRVGNGSHFGPARSEFFETLTFNLFYLFFYNLKDFINQELKDIN